MTVFVCFVIVVFIISIYNFIVGLSLFVFGEFSWFCLYIGFDCFLICLFVIC